MSAAPAQEPHRPTDAWLEATPAQIRAALLPEQVADFDRAWQLALAEAADTFDLEPVTHTLQIWRHLARMAVDEPHEARRLLALSAKLDTAAAVGELDRPGETWEQLKVRLGL